MVSLTCVSNSATLRCLVASKSSLRKASLHRIRFRTAALPSGVVLLKIFDLRIQISDHLLFPFPQSQLWSGLEFRLRTRHILVQPIDLLLFLILDGLASRR